MHPRLRVGIPNFATPPPQSFHPPPTRGDEMGNDRVKYWRRVHWTRMAEYILHHQCKTFNILIIYSSSWVDFLPLTSLVWRERQARRSLLLFGRLLLVWPASFALTTPMEHWLKPQLNWWVKISAFFPQNYNATKGTVALNFNRAYTREREWDVSYPGPLVHVYIMLRY